MKKHHYLSLLLLVAVPAFGSDVNVSGFGTIGVITSDSSDNRFRTDMSQDQGAENDKLSLEPLSKVGVQLDYVINEEWDIVGQFVYRQQDRQNLNSTTSLAFVRYKPNANWQARIGRIYPNIFQQSEVRDIGIAYMWTKVPTEVYGPVPVRNLDGGEVSYDDQIGDWFFNGSLFTGTTKADFTSSAYRPIEFQNLVGVSASIETYDWQIKGRYVQAKFGNSIEPFTEILAAIEQAQPIWPNALNFAADFNFENKTINYGSLYGQYQFDRWQISAELTAFDSGSLVINGTNAGYVNFAFPIDKHTFYYTYSFADSNGHEFDEVILAPDLVEELVLFTQESLSVFNINQTTHSIGWRYDFSAQLAFKLQYEYSDIEAGTGGLRLVEGYRFLTPQRDVSTFFATIDFSF